jgi:hypothetical protein
VCRSQWCFTEEFRILGGMLDRRWWKVLGCIGDKAFAALELLKAIKSTTRARGKR